MAGRVPQSVVWGVEYRTTLDLATNKTSLPYHFVVFTSERCSVPAQENAAVGLQRLLVLPALSYALVPPLKHARIGGLLCSFGLAGSLASSTGLGQRNRVPLNAT